MLDQFFSVVPMPVFIIVVLVGFHFLKKTFMRRRGQKLGVTSSPSSDITPGTLAKVDPAEWKQLNEHHTPKVIGSIASLSTSVDAQPTRPGKSRPSGSANWIMRRTSGFRCVADFIFSIKRYTYDRKLALQVLLRHVGGAGHTCWTSRVGFRQGT